MKGYPEMSGESIWRPLALRGPKHLPPNPRVVMAIGKHHTFNHAVADLVDNSIDAGAQCVLIRFVRSANRLLGLLIVDNGHGMGEEEIDNAMTLGGDREYATGSLGHFGMGLNAASLGQAKIFTVYSRITARQAVGRSASLANGNQDFECRIVAPEDAASILNTHWGVMETSSGTVVRWDHVRKFPIGEDAGRVTAFLAQTTTELRHHLGLVMHRLLEARQVNIWIDIFDADRNEAGPPVPVDFINPFAASPATRAIQRHSTLNSTVIDSVLSAISGPVARMSTATRFPGGTPLKWQGFYFYRHRRLLQAGGWNEIALDENDLQLARVEVDVSDELSEFLTMNPEKTGVIIGQKLVDAIRTTQTPDGWDWESFLNDARGMDRKSRKRSRDRAKAIPPGRGFTPRLKRAITSELTFISGEDPIDFRWDKIEDGAFFAVDREQRTVRLNRDYRRLVIGDSNGSLNDAPLVKTLLYLLVEKLFHGQFFGTRDKDNLDLWRELLTAAADEEQK
ncbi:MAG: ATP-binding protein [Ardenticatenia bacterium]|nr:ATP-binding protein [Ardenticatenia bacterium]